MRFASKGLVAVGLMLCIGQLLEAQTSSRPLGPIRVALILRDAEGTAGTEVVRRKQRKPKDIVLVGRDAKAKDLAAALDLISALRVQLGDSLTKDVRAIVGSYALPVEWDKSPYRSWLDEQLVRLRAAPVRLVRDLGSARVVQITLPAPGAGLREIHSRRR